MNKFLTKLHVVQRWIMTKCLTMNPKAAVIPRAAALTTATLTVTKAVQITSETSYVPSLPLLCCSSLVVGSNILVVSGADLFFIRARMGPFHPRADGTRSHPRADGAPGAIRAALRTWPHDRRNSSILWRTSPTRPRPTLRAKRTIYIRFFHGNALPSLRQERCTLMQLLVCNPGSSARMMK